MANFNWHCPFCNHDAIIQDANRSEFTHEFTPNSVVGRQGLLGKVVYCPNAKCNEYSLVLNLHDIKFDRTNKEWVRLDAKRAWQLIPDSQAKPFPDYIPQPLRSDYHEACLIRDLSPKAAATLARRCLQGMIRDFWGVKKHRLKDEIDALSDKLDSETWAAIDSVRSIGNIGAHMEKDIDLIVDVEPDEASLLIGLIETLLTEWYIARHERQQRMAKIKAVAAVKEQERLNVTSQKPESA